jgi:hypothetical protein
MRLWGLLALAACAASLLPGESTAQATRLEGTVGPGFTISLRTPAGADVSQLDPGTYEIQVRDLSDFHNFHLDGPGVDRTTTVAFEGTVTWTVEFREGRYRFQCDPHSEDMFGLITVGNPPPVTQPPPPPPPSSGTKTPAAKKLTATVGPGSAIALRTAGGAHVHGLKAGRYAITVRDRTAKHNFHLSGAGVNRKTGVPQVATVTWTVTLKKGTLRFFSDAAATKLRGSIVVS